MKKALSILETGLIGALVCIVAIAGFTVFNKLKIKLAKMSAVKGSETIGTLAYNQNGDTKKISIDKCTKIAGTNLCQVYTDKGDKPYVYIETTGVNGSVQYELQFLNNATTASSVEECIGKLAAGTISVCYDKKGNKVECKRDKKGNAINLSKNGETLNYKTTVTNSTIRDGNRTGNLTLVTVLDESGKFVSQTISTQWSDGTSTTETTKIQ